MWARTATCDYEPESQTTATPLTSRPHRITACLVRDAINVFAQAAHAILVAPQVPAGNLWPQHQPVGAPHQGGPYMPACIA